LTISEDSTCSLNCALWESFSSSNVSKIPNSVPIPSALVMARSCEFSSGQKEALSCPSMHRVAQLFVFATGTVWNETTEEFEKRMTVQEQAILSVSETLSTLDTDSESLASFVYRVASRCQQPNELTSHSLSSSKASPQPSVVISHRPFPLLDCPPDVHDSPDRSAQSPRRASRCL
jgi:hypothetical protein